MNMNDKELLDEFAETRNLKETTKYSYSLYLKEYTLFNKKSMQDLMSEAEYEEKKGIRWKNRKLKKRLIKFRNYLYKEHAYSTAKTRFSKLMAFYRHYDIEIHPLPPFSKKNIAEKPPVSFKDLPDKESIKKALKLSKPLMRAVILFMSSSGCAKMETLNLTIEDFINATRKYHNSNNIYEIINILKDHDDIIPEFYIRRQKTNKFYTTFCSPEATSEIVNYLLSVDYKLTPETKLFKIHDRHFLHNFSVLNEKLDLGKVGYHIKFRSHMLRKFHASQLFNDGMSLEEVDSLQGRGKDSTHSSYFMENPEKLKEKYIEHLNAITINLDVNNLDLKSPEYIQLENENKKKDEIIKKQKIEREKQAETLEWFAKRKDLIDKILNEK